MIVFVSQDFELLWVKRVFYFSTKPTFSTMTSKNSLILSQRLFTIMKVLGMTCISIVDGKSVTKTIDWIRFFLSLILGVSNIVASIYYRDSIMNSIAPIASYGNYATFIASVLISLISIITIFVFRDDLWETSLKLANIEDKVRFQNPWKFDSN